MTRAETVLLATASAVLLGGVVAALTVERDGQDAPGAVPGASPSTGPSISPSASPTSSPTSSSTRAPVSVGQVRTGSYARGSHSVVVTVHVTGVVGAALQDGDRTVPLRVVGSTASGTVPVDCSGPVPTWTLALTATDGTVTTAPVPAPVAAFAEACAAPQPAGPLPTATRGS